MGWSAVAEIAALLWAADSAHDQKKNAENAANRAEDQAREQQDQFKAEQKRIKEEKANAEKQAMAKMTRRRGAGGGRSDTILTAPFGLGSDVSGERRTLLGQ